MREKQERSSVRAVCCYGTSLSLVADTFANRQSAAVVIARYMRATKVARCVKSLMEECKVPTSYLFPLPS